MIATAVTFAVALIASSFEVASVAAEKPVSVVLVHGAFVDGSGWQAVYDILTKDGYEVLIVQNPTTSLEGDVAATNLAIGMAKRPVILVGHSYGGMVITEAGNNPKVRSLVYMAAYAPDASESVDTLDKQPTPPEEPKAPLLPAAGWLSVRRSREVPDGLRRRRQSEHDALHGCRTGSVGSAGRADSDHKGRVEDEALALFGDDEGRHNSAHRSTHDGEADWRDDDRDRKQPRRHAVQATGGRELHQGRGCADEIGESSSGRVTPRSLTPDDRRAPSASRLGAP